MISGVNPWRLMVQRRRQRRFRCTMEISLSALVVADWFRKQGRKVYVTIDDFDGLTSVYQVKVTMKEKDLIELIDDDNDLEHAVWVHCPRFNEMILVDYCVQDGCRKCAEP